MGELVELSEEPDPIFSTALLFTYPGVHPEAPDGYLEPNGYADFLGGAEHPFVLNRSRALAAVRKTMDFKLAYAFNMQFSLVSPPPD